jgi:hypothetical protein
MGRGIMTYEETINPSAIKTISDISEIVLPDTFKCPICDAPIYIEEICDFMEEDGVLKALAVKIDCTTFPGFDDMGEFEVWMSEHYSTPYVDWLPLEQEVTAWVNRRYSWEN